MSITSPDLSDNMRRLLAEVTVRNLWGEYGCEISEADLLGLIANDERFIAVARKAGNVQEVARREGTAAKYRCDLHLLAHANLALSPQDTNVCPVCNNARHIPIVLSVDSGPYSRTWRDWIYCMNCMCEQCGRLLSTCECEDSVEDLPL